ncbi:hypothetical protein FRUB_02085 [Fimbriiglobus ruber]|uniref:Uncharacterized protein n=1 Tax=Fimbriiglobus ruber TaxID=1908690 RepID=A0A225E1U8_9BACT|nr:hypothetical protein FRUB_02085 [Fimbriiglobus ruber]
MFFRFTCSQVNNLFTHEQFTRFRDDSQTANVLKGNLS